MGQAIELMAFGMGFVFAFLALLVLMMMGMSRAILAWFPESSQDAPPTTPSGAPADARVRKAITLAVAKYRQKNS